MSREMRPAISSRTIIPAFAIGIPFPYVKKIQHIPDQSRHKNGNFVVQPMFYDMTGSGKTREERRDGRSRIAPVLIVVLLLVSFGIVAAGCTLAGKPAPAPAAAVTPDAAMAGNHLLRNVVNETEEPGGAAHGEDMRAIAIREAMDFHNPVTRDFAVSLIQPEHGGVFRMSQICDIYDAIFARWTYVEDPAAGDYFSPASRTITLGLKGDCDDFAILLAALIESVGGDARVVYVKNKTTGHAYPEAFIGTTPEEFEKAAGYIRQRYMVTDVWCHVTYHDNEPQYWLNLDWWSRHPGGPFFADDGVRTAFYPDGRWEQVES